MNKPGAIGVALLVVALAGAARADSHASCSDRLDAVDAKLAAAQDLDPQLRRALTTFRDQGAAHCAAGNEPSAGAAFTSVEMMLSSTTQAKQTRRADSARKQASKTPLSPAYMTGTWCAVRPRNNERVLWVFGPDGSYRAAPSEFRFAFIAEGSFDEFLAEVDSVAEHGPDRFVVVDGSGPPRSFTRGRGVCHADDAPAPR